MVTPRSNTCQALTVQAAAMTVLGMAGWGLVFMTFPSVAPTTLFAGNGVQQAQTLSRATTMRMPTVAPPTRVALGATRFEAPVHEQQTATVAPVGLMQRSSAAATYAASEVLLMLSPMVLALTGLWYAWKRSTAPRMAFAGNAGQLSQGKSWTIDMSPTVMHAKVAAPAGADLSTAGVAIPETVVRCPTLDNFHPELVTPEGKDYRAISKLHVMVVGVSVHSTPVEIREKLAVAKEDWPVAIEQLVQYSHIQEAGVLSTCNRMEIYVVASDPKEGVRDVVGWMAQKSGLSHEELSPYLFLRQDGDAVDHVLQVSAGLDSLIMGEGQILSQVKSVHQVGSEAKGFGQYLSALFMQAITAGKRVRSETSIATGAVSVSSAAAELAQMKLPGNTWENVRVSIIGAGKMSKLLVKHLVSKGCTKMTIVNRSMPRAQELQEEFPMADMTIKLSPDLMSVVADSDVIFVASSSTEILIHKEDVASMPAPPANVGGMRRFFDISVPRNTSTELNELENAHVFNVDDLKEVVEANKEARKEAAEAALVLLKDEKASFEGWMTALQAVPTIKRLRGKAEAIRVMELEKAKNKLSDDLTPKQLKTLEDLSRGIMNKMLHAPMQALRGDEDLEAHLGNITVLSRVFNLTEEDEKMQKRKK
uniref:Glutamyl-tRNA reductase n=2 Tax=Eutreptiella TaxID=73024 RepID=A0A7S4FPX8_9EUGL